MTHTTESSKEVLHTQGEWKVNYDTAPDLTIYEGEECVATVWLSSDNTKRAELIVKAVNAYGKPRMFPQSPVPIPSDEYIETCVNNYQKLLDSNRELENTLLKCLSYLADLNGSEWIQGDSLGQKEMKGRAKSLQQLAYDAINNAKNILP